MKTWGVLLLAIISEVIGTSALKASAGFTKLWPSALVIVGYGAAFYLLSLTLERIPMGVAYAIWSGLGVALITLAGWVFYGQALSGRALFGIALIVAGAVVLNVSTRHADADVESAGQSPAEG